MNNSTKDYDFGQFRSLYGAYDSAGKCFAEMELLSDSEALAWGNDINESRDDEFYIVAHRRTAGMADMEIGRWGRTQRFDVDPKSYKIKSQ